jgi:hypothetical protein
MYKAIIIFMAVSLMSYQLLAGEYKIIKWHNNVSFVINKFHYKNIRFNNDIIPETWAGSPVRNLDIKHPGNYFEEPLTTSIKIPSSILDSIRSLYHKLIEDSLVYVSGNINWYVDTLPAKSKYKDKINYEFYTKYTDNQ